MAALFTARLRARRYGQGADRRMIAALSRLIGIEPDLTIVLDVTDSVAVSRLLKRGEQANRYERLDAFFHARVNEGFREIARAEPGRCALIAADADEADVLASILAVLQSRLGVPASP